jgi:hypothetical protein
MPVILAVTSKLVLNERLSPLKQLPVQVVNGKAIPNHRQGANERTLIVS